MTGTDESGRAITRRGALASLGALSASLAGCMSNSSDGAETTTTAATTTNKTTTETASATTYETTGLRIPLWDQQAVLVFDRIVVGDKLGGAEASDGHKWVLAPVYLEVDQTESLDVQLPPLGRFRLAGYLGDEPKTQPLGYVLEGRDETRPNSYSLGPRDVLPYPVDGVPETVNDPDVMGIPGFGIVFEAPDNSGYEFQLRGESGFEMLSMVAKPPEADE